MASKGNTSNGKASNASPPPQYNGAEFDVAPGSSPLISKPPAPITPPLPASPPTTPPPAPHWRDGVQNANRGFGGPYTPPASNLRLWGNPAIDEKKKQDGGRRKSRRSRRCRNKRRNSRRRRPAF